MDHTRRKHYKVLLTIQSTAITNFNSFPSTIITKQTRFTSISATFDDDYQPKS
jgi:hypothetical protein